MSRSSDPHHLATAAVVVGIDGSPSSDRAVRWAATTAAGRHRALRLVHGYDLTAVTAIYGAYDAMVPGVADALRERAERVVAAAREVALAAAPDCEVRTETSPEHPSKLLIDASATAHLVVMGAGSGGPLSPIGSTVYAVGAHGHGSIVVVRGDDHPADRPVVVGVDGSRVGEPAVAAAFAEAAFRDAPLIVVHAVNDFTVDAFRVFTGVLPAGGVEAAAAEMLSERLAGWRAKYPEVRVEFDIHPAGPRKHLLRHSETAQLLVVGSRGRGGFLGLLLGSTSNALLHRAACPVLVAHPD